MSQGTVRRVVRPHPGRKQLGQGIAMEREAQGLASPPRVLMSIQNVLNQALNSLGVKIVLGDERFQPLIRISMMTD